MARAALKTETKTHADAIRVQMRFSRFGALSQLFIIDAMQKAMKPIPEHRAREDNEKMVARYLKADALAGRADVVSAVRGQAEAVERAGLEGVRKAFGERPMVHPDAWHGVALEILANLRALD